MWSAWRFWKSSLSRTRTSDKPEHRTELRPQTSGFGGSGRHAVQHASLLARHPLEKHPMPNARTANAVRLEFAPDSLVQSNLSGVEERIICDFERISSDPLSVAVGQAWRGFPLVLMLLAVSCTLATKSSVRTNILRLRCILNALTAPVLHFR